jgi:DNA-binding IclR family transcriptional regulator
MNATREQILAAVNAAPRGATTAQLAHRLGAAKYNVGSILSKLAAYGHIRKLDPPPGNVGFIWSPKAPA